MGKLLQREGAEPRVSVMFYWAVVQAVPLFGAETWFFLEAMSRNLEGLDVVFLKQITRQREVQQKDGTSRSVSEEKVLEKSGTQSP